MCGGGSRAGSTVAGFITPPENLGMVGGRQVSVPGSRENIPGITELAYGLMREGVTLPQQQVAGFSADQQRAFDLAQQGVGSYQPYLGAATGATATGLGSMEQSLAGTRQLGSEIPGAVAPGREALGQSSADARRAAMAGIGGLMGTGGMYDPNAAFGFMSPYEDAAVQQALRDIARQGDIAGQGLRAQAVGSGAFGGSRQAVAEQELQRNVLEQQGRTAAGMRQAGFENAAQRSQMAFEEAMRRQQQAATGIGTLGIQGAQAAGNLGLQGSQLGLAGVQAGLGAQQQAAGLGQGIAGLGQQFAGLGAQQQQMQLQDINTMLTTGGAQQRLGQAQLDTDYQNQYAQMMQPYQQLAFASDIITGAPSGQTSVMSQPGPSVASQAIGLGLAAPAVYQGFQGMMK
jgi:hypothetical protein